MLSALIYSEHSYSAMQQVASTYRYDPTSILDYSGMW